ncbi:MAG: gas vesicle protein GvpO [Nanoarchaeota archaeon]
MPLNKIAVRAMEVIRDIVKKEPLSVISITKEGKNWHALVEVLERRAVPDTQNLIGIYKVNLDSENRLLGFGRTEVRRKSDVGEEGPAEEKAE